jgi:hypothetical protein
MLNQLMRNAIRRRTAAFGVAGVDEDGLYAAMDWLIGRQSFIERKLAGRHLHEGATLDAHPRDRTQRLPAQGVRTAWDAGGHDGHDRRCDEHDRGTVLPAEDTASAYAWRWRK